MDELKYFFKSALLEKAKEMRLQGYHKMKKRELIDLIKNPPPPRPRSTGVRKKVILRLVDSEGEELVFPTITAAAKDFNVKPGRFGWKVSSKYEETKTSIVIDGVRYDLRFESYRSKKSWKTD